MKRVADGSAINIGIEVDYSGEDTVVHLKGHIDVDSSPDVRDRLRAILLNDYGALNTNTHIKEKRDGNHD